MDTREDMIKATIQELLRIAHLYGRIEQMPIPVDEDTEVTTREAHTIQAIAENEPITVTRLSERLGTTKSAASQMVTKLEKRDFLVKKRSLTSNKELALFLTTAGWDVFRAHERFHGKDMAELVERLSTFSLSQIATFSVLLEALGSIMDKRLSNLSM